MKRGLRAGILAQVMPTLHSTAVAIYSGAPNPFQHYVSDEVKYGIDVEGRGTYK